MNIMKISSDHNPLPIGDWFVTTQTRKPDSLNAATESAMLARKAQNTLASLTSKERSHILNEIANSIENEMKAILSANARDVVLFDRPAVGEMGTDEIVCTDTHSITNIIFLNILNTIICIYLTNLLFRKPCNYNRYH